MEHLKALRKEKGVSQQAVADYLGITRQAYSNYENGNRVPDYETLLKLAEYFETTVDALLRGKEKAPTLSGEREPTDRQIRAAFFRGVDPDLTEEDQDDLWKDATEYFQIKVAQRKRKNGDH